MNPEFQRNVWLELTPLRLVVMAAVLALAFFAAALSNGLITPGGVARALFLVLVVVWGTHNAARSVVGEIRDRTWDSQRLSSLGPGTMMWGKLFGATVFNWTGGLVCLAVIAADTLNTAGIAAAFAEVVYYVAMGVIATATSLSASLIGARRRQGRTNIEVFLYQVAGLAAALAVAVIADPTGSSIGTFPRTDTLLWWNRTLPTSTFLLASLAVFAGWMLTGCYRQMRLELKLRNGPWVWLGFLAFMGVYAAGFDAFAPLHFDEITARLMLAGLVIAGLAYVAAILEPKSKVQLRWLGGEFGRFHLGAALSHLQCWMMSYLVAAAIAVALMVRFAMLAMGPELATTGAVLGFVTRDLGVIVLMAMLTRRRGGDLLALAVLILIYWLLPSILHSLQYYGGQALFLPYRTDPLWMSPAAAWLEAVAVWAIAVTQMALSEKSSR
ncbi:hypothetical protein [Rhizomicrobium electricum]|uniref:Uncharacterized protein n=1 Tax=Rhizomicrobium electricum TaxID=480070 RepID=A0ABN1EHV3_9PROT|nr:hypothetical protein [Rhizomicrobium electricum]NIJ48406.1 hypothetical protein [Rhizomicrobium electricum]